MGLLSNLLEFSPVEFSLPVASSKTLIVSYLELLIWNFPSRIFQVGVTIPLKLSLDSMSLFDDTLSRIYAESITLVVFLVPTTRSLTI